MTGAVNEMDNLLKFLCHGDQQKLVNLKFFRGDKVIVESEDICREVHSALEQKRLNLATMSDDPPDGDGDPVDVQTLVDNL